MTADRKTHEAGGCGREEVGRVGRRGLLGGVGLLLGGAAAASAAGAEAAAATPEPAGREAPPAGPTQHQATYYRLARF